MDGENDGAGVQAQGASQQAAQSDQTAQQQAAQGQAVATAEADDTTSGGSEGKDALAQARSDHEAALKERDAQIAELEKTIAEIAKTAEALRAEMDELRRQGDEQRIGFELQLEGAPAPAQTGATGLPNAGAATDEGATMKRWREIAGLDEG